MPSESGACCACLELRRIFWRNDDGTIGEGGWYCRVCGRTVEQDLKIKRERDVAVTMRDAFAAELDIVRNERDDLRKRVAVCHREDQKWWGEQLRRTFARFADIQRRAQSAERLVQSTCRAQEERDQAEAERDDARREGNVLRAKATNLAAMLVRAERERDEARARAERAEVDKGNAQE